MWTKSTANKMLLAKETYVLPSSATIGYSSVIDFLIPDAEHANKKVLITFNVTALSGTNLDMALYGSDSIGGTKVLLLDAIVADITVTGANPVILDLNAYPAPYYYLAWTADQDEKANSIAVKIMTV